MGKREHQTLDPMWTTLPETVSSLISLIYLAIRKVIVTKLKKYLELRYKIVSDKLIFSALGYYYYLPTLTGSVGNRALLKTIYRYPGKNGSVLLNVPNVLKRKQV